MPGLKLQLQLGVGSPEFESTGRLERYMLVLGAITESHTDPNCENFLKLAEQQQACWNSRGRHVSSNYST